MVAAYPLRVPVAWPCFGVSFNTARSTFLSWFLSDDNFPPWTAPLGFPTALCFTMTIHDSKGVIKNGQTFTHIIDLDK